METDMTRRTALAAAGAGGIALLVPGCGSSGGGTPAATPTPTAGEATAACVMTPDKTVGPFFVDEMLERADVRASSTGDTTPQEGVALRLGMQVFDADDDCAPVAGAKVDIWHANAEGAYSAVDQNGTADVDWLRGWQRTDDAGRVEFRTIFPGWYTGRAVHIHFKVRVEGSGDADALEFTSQLFFDPTLIAEVFGSRDPYDERDRTDPDTSNASDGILGSDASTLTLDLERDGDGYRTDFSVGVSRSTSRLNDTGTGGAGGPGAPGGGPGGAPPDGAGPPPEGTTGVGATGTATRTTTIGHVESPVVDGRARAVDVALTGVRNRRSVLGRRSVELTLRAREPVRVEGTLSRSGRILARRQTRASAGRLVLRLHLPDGAEPGGARLRLVLTDAAGDVTRYTRAVHVAA